MTLVIATGGVDISVGSIMAISGAVAATGIVSPYSCLIRAVFLALLVSIGSLWNGYWSRLAASSRWSPPLSDSCRQGITQLITDSTITLPPSPSTRLAAGISWIAGSSWLAATIFLIALALTIQPRWDFIKTIGNRLRPGTQARRQKIVWITYVLADSCRSPGLSSAPTSSAPGVTTPDSAEWTRSGDRHGGTSMTEADSTLRFDPGRDLIQELSTVMYANGVNPAVIAVPKAILVIAVACNPTGSAPASWHCRFSASSR